MKLNELFHDLADFIKDARANGERKYYQAAVDNLKEAETIAHDNQCYDISTSLRLIITGLESKDPEFCIIHLMCLDKTIQDLKRLLDTEGN